jgi:hypothetical protein
VNLKVTTDIDKNSTGGNTEDIDGDGSVTLTAQLVDGTGAAVAKAGVEVSLTVVQGINTLHPGPAPMKTDDDGQVTYTASGPKSTKGAVDVDRTDTVQFRADANGDDDLGDADTDDASDPSEQVTATIEWTDSNPTLVTAAATTDNGDNVSREAEGSGKGSSPDYALVSGQGKITIRASVTFYDQYGNTIGKGNKVDIDIGAADPAERTVSSRGVASYRTTVDAGTPGTDIDVTYTDISDSDGDSVPGAPSVTASMVTPVRHAPDDSSAPAADLDAVYADDNRFRIAGLLYTYDSDDTFVDGTDNGAVVDMAKFESLIKQTEGGNAANVQVVSYDDDGDSIFRVVTAGT